MFEVKLDARQVAAVKVGLRMLEEFYLLKEVKQVAWLITKKPAIGDNGLKRNVEYWETKSSPENVMKQSSCCILYGFQNEAKCETFVVKMSFICIILENHFYINGFALSLVLKVRFFGTRKWPIVFAV